MYVIVNIVTEKPCWRESPKSRYVMYVMNKGKLYTKLNLFNNFFNLLVTEYCEGESEN